MERSDFTYSYDLYGYMIYYRGKPLGGAGTMKKSKHWRNQRADLKMYQEAAEREIHAILRGQGQVRFMAAIQSAHEGNGPYYDFNRDEI